MRSRPTSPVALGLLASVLAGIGLVAWLSWVPSPSARYFPPNVRHGFVSTYDPPTNRLEVTADSGDGQSYAALASDPSLARPEVFYQGPSEAAYRAQRPFASWLAWALGLGQPGAVPYLLALIAVVGVGAFVGTAAALAKRLGRDPQLSLLLIVAPGAVADLKWLCPDVLGAGLALGGYLLWTRSNRRVWPAVALFTMATLTRETLLVVPAVIALDALPSA